MSYRSSMRFAVGPKAFGNLQEGTNSSNYTTDRTAKATYCVPNTCVPAVKLLSQGDRLKYSRSAKLTMYPCVGTLNRSNLSSTLVTQLNLAGVEVVSDLATNVSPAPISLNANPYLVYNVDPNGSLFGNNTCGIYNFENYLQYTGLPGQQQP